MEGRQTNIASCFGHTVEIRRQIRKTETLTCSYGCTFLRVGPILVHQANTTHSSVCFTSLLFYTSTFYYIFTSYTVRSTSLCDSVSLEHLESYPFSIYQFSLGASHLNHESTLRQIKYAEFYRSPIHPQLQHVYAFGRRARHPRTQNERLWPDRR